MANEPALSIPPPSPSPLLPSTPYRVRASVRVSIPHFACTLRFAFRNRPLATNADRPPNRGTESRPEFLDTGDTDSLQLYTSTSDIPTTADRPSSCAPLCKGKRARQNPAGNFTETDRATNRKQENPFPSPNTDRAGPRYISSLYIHILHRSHDIDIPIHRHSTAQARAQ